VSNQRLDPPGPVRTLVSREPSSPACSAICSPQIPVAGDALIDLLHPASRPGPVGAQPMSAMGERQMLAQADHETRYGPGEDVAAAG